MNDVNNDIFAKNLNKYIKNSGKDRSEIAKTLNVPYSTLTDWTNGKKYPRIRNIEKLANYFGVTKSDLIEDVDKKKKDNDALSTIIVKIRMDDKLLEVVEKVVSLDNAKLDSLHHLLDTFI